MIYMNHKNNIKRKIAVAVLTLMVSSVSFVHTVFASGALTLVSESENNSLSVVAFDTVSGIEGLVKVRDGGADDVVVITLTDPSRAQHSYQQVFDASGSVDFTIPAVRVQKEGLYRITARSGANQGSTTFTVFGDSSAFTGMGGDENIVAVNATVVGFKIDNAPASVSIGDRLNFTIKAVDANDVVVPTYKGTVHFSSTDRNAQLPEDYTFVSSDQGQRTFDLATTLRTSGSQKIFADDTVDEAVRGELIINVLRGSFSAGNGDIYITKPNPGTYSSATLDIEGNAPANTKIAFYDNNQQIGEKQSDTGGRFSLKTPLLTDGPHRFYVSANGNDSEPVEVTIDLTPAKAENVQLGSTILAPGGATSITVTSDPDVSQIRATIGDYITDLTQDSQNPTRYTGQLIAPQAAGDYTVNVIVSDRFGNSADTVEVGSIKVDAALQNEGTFDFAIPSTVTGVVAKGVLNGVLLTWQDAQAQSGVAFYRIYYGTDPNDLKQVITTKTNETNYLVTGLTVGTQYYFKLSAIDMRSNESDNLSAMASATPSATDTSSQVVAGGDLPLCDPSPCPTFTYPPNTTQNGPALLIPLIGSLFGGLLTLRKK